jgi:F-type H+-transporting ATPase subunit a
MHQYFRTTKGMSNTIYGCTTRCMGPGSNIFFSLISLTVYLYSPLEQFTVVSLSRNVLSLFGDALPLTNLGLSCILTVSLVLGLHLLANHSYALVPSHWSVALESAYITVSAIARDQIGDRHEVYTPLVVGLFFWLLFTNLQGNVPYGFTVTTSAIAAMGLSVTVFLAVTAIGLTLHKVHFFSFFVPNGTPLALVPLLTIIELISYLARAVSLGVRLFANMVAGHTLLKILASFLIKLFSTSFLVAIATLVPYAIFVGLIGLELAVSLIQSYVFVVLTCSYLKDALELH